MSRRRKQAHLRRAPHGRATSGTARFDVWPFAFQDLVDQGRVVWLPDVDVQKAGTRLVVHVPSVGDFPIELGADALDAAPARNGFILRGKGSEWSLILGTGTDPGEAGRNALDELTQAWVEELGEGAVERHCAQRAAIYPEILETALTCLRLSPAEFRT